MEPVPGLSSSSPAAPNMEALERRHGTQFPHHMSIFCRQKQYYGVASSLEFQYPFLATAHAQLEDEAQEGLVPCDEKVRLFVRTFFSQLSGAPASLDHHGPLLLAHVGALREVTNAQVFSFFKSHCWVPRGLEASLGADMTLFAEPSPLMRVLWEPASGIADRYAAAIRIARADKPKYYRELKREGYLCEPGLHALRVFAPSLSPPPTAAEHTSQQQQQEGETAPPCAATALPHATFTPRQEAHWRQLIDAYSLSLPDRSHIHELENLTQEIAIGELLADAIGVAIPPPSPNAPCTTATSELFATTRSRLLDCVVDVGGGNAFLAAEVGERLGCDSVVIDPHYPPHSVDCCPRMWPDTAARVRPSRTRQHVIHRKVALFKDIAFRRDIPAAPERCAFIAKHLCGTAVDECLRQLEMDNCWPRILILVPCCFHKGEFDTYVNESFLRDVMHVHSQDAYTRLTKLTDWNRSIYQRCELDSENPDAVSSQSPQTGTSRKRSRKSNHKARTIDYLVGCQEALAASVEALLNRGRMLWLQTRGYDVRLLEYVPDYVTPKNKCIVAVRREAASSD